MGSIKRGFFAVIASVALLSVGVVTVPAQQPEAVDPDLDDPVSTSVLPPVDQDIDIAGPSNRLAVRLARIEAEVARGWVDHFAGRPEHAAGAFSSAMSSILLIRSETVDHEEPTNPMVRLHNHDRKTSQLIRTTETWVPLTIYMNTWISRMPEALQAEMEKRFGGNARASLRSAIASDSLAALRDHVELHYFTEAGRAGLDRLVGIAFENGDFAGVVSWLLPLREGRPSVWRSSPQMHLWLIGALAALAEQQQLSIVEQGSRELFSGRRVTVGREQVGFGEAIDQIKQMLAPTSPERLPLPTGLGPGQVQDFESDNLDSPSNDPEINLPVRAWIPSSSLQAGMSVHVIPAYRGSDVYLPRHLAVARHGESEVLWLSQGSQQEGRLLQLAEDRRHVKPAQSRDRYSGWRYNARSDDPPAQRVLGVSFGKIPVRGRDGAVGYSEVAASVMTTGRTGAGPRTGNQIQVFDLGREGAALLTLPLEQEVKLGDRVVEKPQAEPGLPLPGNQPDNKPAEEEVKPEDLTREQRLAEQGYMLGRTHFSGVPVISRGRLFIAGSVVRQSSMEGRVFCFDLTGADGPRGRLLWSNKLSGVTAIMDWWSVSTSLREAATISLEGGRLLVSSNHGSVVCLDAEDGRPYWITAYRLRGSQRDTSMMRFSRYSNSGFTPVMRPDPPVRHGTTVIAAPSDSVTGLSLDLATGTALATTLERERKFETSPYFVGVLRGRAYYLTVDGIVSEAATFGRQLPDGKGGYVPGSLISSTGLKMDQVLTGIAPLLVPEMGQSGAVLVAQIDGVGVLDAATLNRIALLPWPEAPKSEDLPAPEPKANQAKAASKDELEAARKRATWNLQRVIGALTMRTGPNGPELGLLTAGRLVHFKLLDN